MAIQIKGKFLIIIVLVFFVVLGAYLSFKKKHVPQKTPAQDASLYLQVSSSSSNGAAENHMSSKSSFQEVAHGSSSNASVVQLGATPSILAPIDSSQQVNSPKQADLSEYITKTPKVFRVPRETIAKGSYSADISELKYKAEAGDLYAKWLYAQRMQEQLDRELDRRYPIQSSIPTEVAKEWLKKYEEVRQLYYSCAVEGAQGCVHGLIQTPYHPSLRDEVDTVAWIFVMGGMTGLLDQAFQNYCTSQKINCTKELISKGYERFSFYLDYYKFNLEKPASAM